MQNLWLDLQSWHLGWPTGSGAVWAVVFNFVAWQGWAAQEAALTTWDVFYHSGRRMLPLVSGHAYVEPETLNAIRAACAAFFSASAAILSPFLLFLMALALRLKFRMSV